MLLEGEAPAAPTPGPAAPPRGGDLLRRLADLGTERAGRADPGRARSGPALAELVGGAERATAAGPFLYVERRMPLDRRHGEVALARARGVPVPLRRPERGPEGRTHLRAEEAVFLDTETTGLSGGTGTVAFLVGTGAVEDGLLVVRQYCMRDYPEEPALLLALHEDLGDRPLVTFNGRAFDWPLLTTRFALNRLSTRARAHLDLLPLARRLWADSVASHTLGALETALLGHARVDDLRGAEIPAAYFAYVRGGPPHEVARAFAHNETDVVSMVALMALAGETIAAPWERTSATTKDLLATARLLEEIGRRDDVGGCLERALEVASPRERRVVLRALGHACRREGRWDDALQHFDLLASAGATFESEAYEQVAKIHEHRRHDLVTALTWTDRALARAAPGSPAADAFRHRRARLLRKLSASSATAGSAPARGPAPPS